jgi:hypothetical protein
VRGQIGAKVNLRLTPEIRFEYDDSIEEEEMVQQVGRNTPLWRGGAAAALQGRLGSGWP